MAASQAIKSRGFSVKLNNGTTETGKVKLASVSFAELDKTGTFDADKAMNIVAALTPCLTLTYNTSELKEVFTVVSA